LAAGVPAMVAGQSDTTPPKLMSISEWHGSTGTWVLYIDERLNMDSTPAREAFLFQIGGVDRDLGGVRVGTYGPFPDNRGRSLELTPSPKPTPAQVRQVWRLVYTPPSENPLKDLAGNLMEAFDASWGYPSGGGPPPPEPEPEPEPEPPPPLPVPPEAAFTVDVPCVDGLCRARTGEGVTFADTSSGTVARRSWDFDVGRGRTTSAATTRHAWSSPGFYEVTLTVSGAGAESTASRVFLVEAADPAGTCEPDPETVCLQDSRYQVRATWQSPDGDVRPARAAHAGTNDSGLLWFHDAENWEVLIKVLDGCAKNGHMWVYGGSTTDLGFLIRITDTVTGASREYRNEPGTPATAIADTTVFADSCRSDVRRR